MKKYLYVGFGLLLAISLTRAQDEKSQTKPTGDRVLKVKLHYTGAGTVDEKHKIFVVLFDSPAFTSGGAMPIAGKAATGKDETVTFSDVTTSPVYVAASYEPSGNYDGQSGPPPSGASLGMFSKTPGTPEPINIEPGKTVQVEVAFDDTHKMP
jgi:hypothetical protein